VPIHSQAVPAPPLSTTARSSMAAALLLAAASPVLAQVIIPDARTCPGCRIQQQVMQRLGARDGPGALPGVEPSSVARDPQGRFWLAFFGQSLPQVFNASGQWVQEIGARGEGPGEFQEVQIVARIPGDSMLVLDRRGTATILDADLRAVRHVRLATGNPFDVETRFWPTLVLSSAYATPDRIGWPLHAFNMSGPQASPVAMFGFEEQDVRIQRGIEGMASSLRATRAGTVWAFERMKYRFSECSPEGQLIRVLERQPRWFVPRSGRPVGTRDEPPPSYVIGGNIDSEGRLWIYSVAASPRWREAWSNVPRAPGRGTGEARASVAMPDPDLLFHTIIEVLDPATNRLVATARTSHRVIKVLPEPGLVVAHRVEDDGTPVLLVLQFRLRAP
jgi:hypothetical protein